MCRALVWQRRSALVLGLAWVGAWQLDQQVQELEAFALHGRWQVCLGQPMQCLVLLGCPKPL